MYIHRYGAGEIGTQKPGKKMVEEVVGVEGEGEGEDGK